MKADGFCRPLFVCPRAVFYKFSIYYFYVVCYYSENEAIVQMVCKGDAGGVNRDVYGGLAV